jgi:hypothetical protein
VRDLKIKYRYLRIGTAGVVGGKESLEDVSVAELKIDNA